ncbi:hypothetical protein PGUG_04029 [Meyerozyma guilliermondii ATCC 6260]|uniref:Exoribonuclease phosphorolytic domain-containing protein n=2 Tax=Dikarya TaxID=451864 RepID=A5DL78_PICGU|nr:uncharacterized protein PGUG_04029 [Meyerozyma guilliermondii ATCC 6260]EDK39931.1 hypothetical protein PGUG_04029 [Meyerozyma guilliermondii ATCC 6260]
MNISDRRRLLGPSEARFPSVGVSSSLEREMKSPDEETAKSSMFLKTGLVDTASGSAYVEADDCIVQVSVYGPRPIRGSFIEKASFSVECKFLPYVTKVAAEHQNTNPNGKPGMNSIEQRISTYVETALLPCLLLENYPKSTIDIYVTVIANKSASLLELTNWIVNCSSLALVDSAIEIKDIVTGGVATIEDENDSKNSQCLASFMNLRNNEIVGFWIDGGQELNEKVLTKTLETCQERAQVVRRNFNGFLTT